MRRLRPVTDQTPLNRIIAILMTAGITAGVLFELVGMVLYYHARGGLDVSMDRTAFIHGQNVLFLIYEIVQTVGRQGGGIFFLTLGIGVLIITPYLRVLISVVYFVWKKDYRYVSITLLVLIILTLSLTLH